MQRRISSLAFVSGAILLLTIAACGPDEPRETPEAPDYETVNITPGNLAKVDFTVVVDDSGSMCDEQALLAAGLPSLAQRLTRTPVDFHIGVTTTSLDEAGELGALNSVPNPVPTETEGCEVSSGLVATQLERAIACAEDPSAFEDSLPLSSEQQTCIDDPPSCAISDFELSDLFPPEYAYRELPSVLKRDDYLRSDYTLDEASLRADFACLSFVGTRGSSFEKGLGALVAATSPSRVGEVYESGDIPPEDATNYGLIREDASTAVIFVTDENDCTYSNPGPDDAVGRSIDEDGPCGDEACYYANSTKLDAGESPLRAPAGVRQEWADTLSALKQRTVRSRELFAFSAHGQPVRFEGEWPEATTCEAGDGPEIQTTCSSASRSARSGDRYQRFIEQFDEGSYWPTSGDPVKGEICTANPFGDLFEWRYVGPTTETCLTENPTPCATATDCPTPRVPGADASCVDFAASGEKYCRGSVEVVLTASETLGGASQTLEDSELCATGTMADVDGEVKCFLKPEHVQLRACSENHLGLTPRLAPSALERVRRLRLDVEMQWPSESASGQ